jgi:cobalamin-dependent methionine synthase I
VATPDERSESLLAALRERVVVADGGMGTMLQAAGVTLADTEGHDGRPRLREWPDRIRTDRLVDAAVVYGYAPVWSEGDAILAEALAESWHARVRAELGLGGEDAGELDGILRQGYRGSRYSFGYPACPDLEHRRDLVEWLDSGRVGVELSEELQLHPEQSTDAIVVHHPEATYFNAT